MVLLIPTKELVFHDLAVLAGAELPEPQFRLVAFEQEMWERTRRFLRDRGVPYIDALPALRECLGPGVERPSLSGAQPRRQGGTRDSTDGSRRGKNGTLARIDRQPYRTDWDGHPNPAGHCAIARLVVRELRRMGLLSGR
ncbi:MAG: hypothetical protein ACYTKD_30570 [Planctomycetota bacterium]